MSLPWDEIGGKENGRSMPQECRWLSDANFIEPETIIYYMYILIWNDTAPFLRYAGRYCDDSRAEFAGDVTHSKARGSYIPVMNDNGT